MHNKAAHHPAAAADKHVGGLQTCRKAYLSVGFDGGGQLSENWKFALPRAAGSHDGGTAAKLSRGVRANPLAVKVLHVYSGGRAAFIQKLTFYGLRDVARAIQLRGVCCLLTQKTQGFVPRFVSSFDVAQYSSGC